MRKEQLTQTKLTKKDTLVLAGILLMCFSFGSAGHSETVSGTASVTIKELVQISESQSMDFGTVLVQSGQAQTITIGTDGSISTGGNGQSGIFSASGVPNSAVTISFSDTLLSAGTSTMPLNNFVHDAGATPTFNGSGALEFKIGADIKIAENQAAGTYSGTYQLSVNYQ